MLNLIIPMAGKGKRMLPHTLTTPKPLIPIAGKPIVERLVQGIRSFYTGPIAKIGFVVRELTPSMQEQLTAIALSVGAKPHFYEQTEALGTAHAISCAAPLLQGPIIIAFADTLFTGATPLDLSKENVIWVSPVEDPSSFGVVELRDNQAISRFIEKPKHFISNLAIIGIYYFRAGEILQQTIQSLITANAQETGEYQLTTALTHMQQQGSIFYSQSVKEWLDCGNKHATLHTNQRFLHLLQDQETLLASNATITNSTIIPPIYVGPDVHIKDSIVGPYVSVGKETQIINSRIKNSIIQEHTCITGSNLHNSMVGRYANIQGKPTEINVGDHTMLSL
jgi:glucose-1-phosphate thymidylyltransferase